MKNDSFEKQYLTGDPTRTVKCPTCKADTAFTPANPFRPFCSERCRTLDLGDWAAENYRIVAEKIDENDLDLLDDEKIN